MKLILKVRNSQREYIDRSIIERNDRLSLSVFLSNFVFFPFVTFLLLATKVFDT